MERNRARGLLNHIRSHGLDLLAGVPKDNAEELHRRQREAQSQLASLQKQCELLAQRKDVTEEQRKQEREKLEGRLRGARASDAAAYAAIRNASPAYRLAVGEDLKPVSLERLQSWVAEQKALLLEYLAGSDGGYVLVVPSEDKARLETLAIDTKTSKRFGRGRRAADRQTDFRRIEHRESDGRARPVA